MPDNYFYTTGTEGIEYDTPDEMAAWLYQRPDEIQPWRQKMYDLADNFSFGKDYKGMRQALLMVVDTLAALDELAGEKHLK